MISGTLANNGFIISMNDLSNVNADFTSSDDTTASNRPKLIIYMNGSNLKDKISANKSQLSISSNGRFIKIHTSLGKMTKLELFSSQGRRVFLQISTQKETKIPVSVSEGTYIATVKTTDGFALQKIFIK